MKYAKSDSKYIVSLEKGEKIIESLKSFCVKEKISLASVQAIGAVINPEFAFFNPSDKKYTTKKFPNAFELTSLCGNVTLKDSSPYLHFHVTLGDENFISYSGHLVEAEVNGAFEAVFDIISGEIKRRFNDDIGLNLLDL